MKRKFSVKFGRSVTMASGRADRLEIIVQSLGTSSSAFTDTTFPPVYDRKLIALSDMENIAEFELEPSYQPGFDRPILYRVSWRQGHLGRVESTDFTMPNADITYDDLTDLGAIVGAEAYLQESDLGIAGRVAKLNDDGFVVDASGRPITGSEGVDDLKTALAVEEQARRGGDLSNRAYASQQLELQINSVVATTTAKINQAITEFRAADLTEASTREAAVTALNTYVSAVVASHSSQLSALGASVSTLQGTMQNKADLIAGKIPTNQIPSIALGTAVSVDTQAQMLALTTTQVQQGDFAIRPDSTWILLGDNPALLSSWKRFALGGGVSSVNGLIGAVVLTASDVGARPMGVSIAQSEINGLTAALADKLTMADMASIQTALGNRATSAELAALRNEAVLKVAGAIPTALLGPDVPLVNNLNQLVKKDGTVLSTGGSGGGAVASVNGKIGTVVLLPPDVGARDITVKVPLDDVNGLTAALAAKATTASVSALSSRMQSAEADIDALQASSGGGTGGGARNTVSWGTSDGSTNVGQAFARSPFGRTSDGTLYYNNLGAVDTEAVVPYVNISGAITFRKVTPGAQPDPAWTPLSSFTALQEIVQAKASQADLNALSTTVSGKASQADLTALTTTVSNKAEKSALTALQSALADKASQEDLDNLSSALQSKVDASTYAERQSSIDQQLMTKYQVPAAGIPQSTLDSGTRSKIDRGDAAKTGVDAATSTAAANSLVKTDSNGQFSVAAASAAGHPYRKEQVDTALALKANQADITAALTGKADLVNGKVPNSQISAIITHETVAVANRSAMLALTSSQVQLGDTAIISGTSDVGTYTLIAADPSSFGNWLKHQAPVDVVQSVNGFQGVVVLSATDVGARSASVAIPLADVSGLSSALSAKADVTYVNTQVNTRTTPAQVTETVAQLPSTKLRVKYAATAPVLSLSGQQSVDGVLLPLDTRVLLPLQNSSIQNGIWIVKSGAWTRPSDMASGSSLMPYTTIAITDGATNADSLWQMTTGSVVTVDSTGQPWEKVLRGGVPKTYTSGNGIEITGTSVAAKAAPNGNIIVASDGIKLDPTGIVRKFVYELPAGSAQVTIPHNLNTAHVLCQLKDKATGDLVLVGATIIGLNSCSVELEAAPAAGQWDAIVIG